MLLEKGRHKFVVRVVQQCRLRTGVEREAVGKLLEIASHLPETMHRSARGNTRHDQDTPQDVNSRRLPLHRLLPRSTRLGGKSDAGSDPDEGSKTTARLSGKACG